MIESTRYLEIIVGFFSDFFFFYCVPAVLNYLSLGLPSTPILQVKKLRQSDHVASGCTTNTLWFTV